MDETDADLIKKIEALKSEIKEFEAELGIYGFAAPQFARPVREKVVAEQVIESAKKLESIESTLRVNKREAPGTAVVEEEAALPAGQVQQVPHEEVRAPVGVVNPLVSSLHTSSEELQNKAEQVEQINSLISKLRDSVINTAPKPVQPPIHKQTSGHPQAAAEKPTERAVTTPKPVVQPSQAVGPTVYSQKDLADLITMLKKLIQQNIELSDKLRELLEQNKGAKSSSSISELTRRLAMAGLNG